MIRKVKSSPKMFKSEPEDLKKIVLRTMGRISEIVGATYGPGGKNVLIESDHPGIANKNTKDGVTVFNSLGSANSYEHLVIEQARDAAKRTATEAGDGPQPLYSKVLTPKGFVEMGSIEIGMDICGTKGTTQKVLGVFPKGRKEIVKLTFSENRTVECSEDHLWTIFRGDSYSETITAKKIYGLLQDQSTDSNQVTYFTPQYNSETKDRIIKVEYTGNFTEMQCIKVSNDDHLYVTDGYIMTHNTTTATIMSAALIENLHAFTEANRKYSPQKAAREMSKMVREILVPEIQKKAIKIDVDNKELLRMVAKISANGDMDMANAVIEAFELIGYGESSHVTIKEASGPYGYNASLIEGFPVPIGYEESMGKFHAAFINDQSNQRCFLEKPLFLLFDGTISDIVMIKDILENVGEAYSSGLSEHKNLVIFAHGYSDTMLNQLMWNFQNPLTVNVVPMIVPRDQFINAELQTLMDLSAFTGARIFGLKTPVNQAQAKDLGSGMTAFEIYRFRSTVVGESDQMNVEIRAEELKTQKKNCQSEIEGRWLDERLGKLTNGIARLTVFGGSGGEVKEKCDRVEDSVMAIRSSISKGVLAGGCRTFIDLAIKLGSEYPEDPIAQEILVPSLLTPIFRLLDNAGYSDEEASVVVEKLMEDPSLVYDVENQVFGTAEELGVYDAAPAVEESLKNACGIATVLGTIGGIVAYPRDDNFERSEASADRDFDRVVNSPEDYVNEANIRS